MPWTRFWQRRRRDRELARELEAYLELETAEQMAAGKSAGEARLAAHRKLGNITRVREDVYDRNSIAALETIRLDVAYAWRLLSRHRGFAVVAVLSMALGIGANTAVFTILDQVALRALPVADPDRLVVLTPAGYQYGNAWGDGGELSYPMYEDLRDNTDVFTGMFAQFRTQLDVSIGAAAERVSAELVSGDYFPLLGIRPALGRVFGPQDDMTEGGHPVIVLSHRYWRDRFASDPGVVGRPIRAGTQLMTIVGVASDGFGGTDLVLGADLFVPLKMAGDVKGITAPLSDRRMRWVTVFGQVRPDVSAESAGAAVQPYYRSRLAFEAGQDAFARASPSDKARFVNGSIDVTAAPAGKSSMRSQLTRPLQLLTGIGIMVLVIACANVANLLLARATVRRREMAVRLALGATRRRLVRQLLVESVLVALAGGIAGLLLATWGAQILLGFLTEREPALAVTAWPDGRILAVNVLVSVAAGILFGLAPAWQGTRGDVTPALKADATAVSGGGHARLRRGLVVGQVMLSLWLLVVAGVFLRSLDNLLTEDAGFDSDRLLAFSVAPSAHGYPAERTKVFARMLLERVRDTPSVAGAGFVSHALLGGDSWSNNMTVEGRPYNPDRRIVTFNNWVSPGYFQAMGIRLLAGRDFDRGDERDVPRGAVPTPPRVAIANEQFVREFLNGRDPIGVHVGFGRDPATPTPTEIVGVVATARYTSMRSGAQPQLYFPYFETAAIDTLTMYVRTSQSPDALQDRMRGVVQQLDPTLPIHDVRTIEQQISRSLILDRMIARLSSVLAGLAVLLAMVGLYGVMAYTVSRRTREIAVRMALGAAGSKVAALVVKDMLTLVVSGVLLAVPAVWALGRVLGPVLHEVTATDPATLVAAVGVLLGGAFAAIWIPSRRALQIDPTAALHDE